jgi:ribonuclease P protein component
MGDQRLRSSERLRQPRDYQCVFQRGKKLVAPAFVLYVLPERVSCSRLGMAVSKRIGKAVVRNRVKRHLREVFRRQKGRLHVPCDVVIVARRQAAQTTAADFRRQFLTLLRRYQQAEVCERRQRQRSTSE